MMQTPCRVSLIRFRGDRSGEACSSSPSVVFQFYLLLLLCTTTTTTISHVSPPHVAVACPCGGPWGSPSVRWAGAGLPFIWGAHNRLAEGDREGGGGVLRLVGGGRLARERMGEATPKRWGEDKVRASRGGGVVKKRRSDEGDGKKNFRKEGRGSTGRLSKEEIERLRLKKKSYKDLIKRSKEWRTDRTFFIVLLCVIVCLYACVCACVCVWVYV